MAKRGPAPTPTAVLSARGSWRAKTRTGEPKAAGTPRRPKWLTDEAGKVWARVYPLLTNMGVARRVDENALARYCDTFARWRECCEFIDKHGMVIPVKDADGKLRDMKEFPQVGRASRLADQLLKLEQQFGMTPSARASLVTEDKETDADDKQRFFKPKLTG